MRTGRLNFGIYTSFFTCLRIKYKPMKIFFFLSIYIHTANLNSLSYRLSPLYFWMSLWVLQLIYSTKYFFINLNLVKITSLRVTQYFNHVMQLTMILILLRVKCKFIKLGDYWYFERLVFYTLTEHSRIYRKQTRLTFINNHSGTF